MFLLKKTDLLVLVAVSAHELFDSTSAVHDLLLTCVERVSKRANFDIDYVIFDAINGLGFVSLDRRNAGPLVIAVNEKYRMVGGMDFGLHKNLVPLVWMQRGSIAHG